MHLFSFVHIVCVSEREMLCARNHRRFVNLCVGGGGGEGNIDGVCVNDAICVKERPIYIYVCAWG